MPKKTGKKMAKKPILKLPKLTKNAKAEIARFFSADEMFSYDFVHDGYLYGKEERDEKYSI